MKNNTFRFSLSAIVLTIFIVFAASYTLDMAVTAFANMTYDNALKKYTTTQTIVGTDNQMVITGPRIDGVWLGGVTIQIKNSDGSLRSTENATFQNGVRNGRSVTTVHPSGPTITRIYERGRLVRTLDNSTSLDLRLGQSSYSLLESSFPWYLEQYFDNPSSKVAFSAFLDEMDERLDEEYGYDVHFFEENFEEILFDLEDENMFLDQIDAYENLLLMDLHILFTNFEFRRAIHDKFKQRKQSSYQALHQTYPNFIEHLESAGHNLNEIEHFCLDFESSVSTLIDLEVDDPMFSDSLDIWIFRVFQDILEDEEFISEHLSATNLSYEFSSDQILVKAAPLKLVNKIHEMRSNSIAVDVLSILLDRRYDSDYVMIAAREAFLRRNGHVVPPVMTVLTDGEEDEPKQIRGNILLRGTEDISEVGFVWDTAYWPDLSTNRKVETEENGEFWIDLDEFEENKRYFIRSYAIYNGETVFSDMLELFLEEETTSVTNRNLLDLEFNYYPNPSSGEINIDLGKPYNSTKLTITDMKGNIVFFKTYHHLSIINEHLNLASGDYTLTILADRKISSKHLIIIK